MFKKTFDWLDKRLGKSDRKWRALLEIIPLLLFVLQLAIIFSFGQFDVKSLILNTPLAIISFCTYPLAFYAKKKYRIRIVWYGFAKLVPVYILIFYVVEAVFIIQQIINGQ